MALKARFVKGEPQATSAMQATIRSYRREDAAGVGAVIVPIQREEFGIPITLEEQPDLLDIPGFYQRGDGNFWVAVRDETVVGTIGLLDIGQRQGALRKMFVLREHRGREQGVAQKLLDRLLEWAAERGMTDIFLGTTEKFLAAHRFYERNGFEEVPKPELPEAFPVMAVDSKFYRLGIRAAGI